MPSLASVINKFARQTMVYWPNLGPDGNGRPTYDPNTGIEIAVRWEDRQIEKLTPDNRLVMTKGYILTSKPLVVGSWVFLGTLVQWRAMPSFPSLPTSYQGGRELIVDNANPDLKNTSMIYEAFL